MPRANIFTVSLTWHTNPPRTIDLRATGKFQTAGNDVSPQLQGTSPSNRERLAGLLSRWGTQLSNGNPITADLTDDGKSFV